MERAEAVVVGVPGLVGVVVGHIEFVGTVEGEAERPFVAEVPTDISVEREGECFETLGGIKVLSVVGGLEILVKEVFAAGCRSECETDSENTTDIFM